MNENDFLNFFQLDYPEGKEMKIGPQRALIYERAIEDGYVAGIRACAEAGLADGWKIELLTDQEYTRVLDERTPAGLSPRNRETWRAYFIAGWVWVCLATPGVADQIRENDMFS